MQKVDKAIQGLINFGKAITKSLGKKKSVTELEKATGEALANLTPEDLGYVGMICVLFLTKIADEKVTIHKENEEPALKTAVICSRALVSAINESTRPFQMDSIDIAIHMGLSPTLSPSPESIIQEVLTKKLEEIDCVGEC